MPHPITTFAVALTAALSGSMALAQTCHNQPPSTVAASDGTNCEGVLIDWSDVPFVTGYAVLRATSPNGPWNQYITPTQFPYITQSNHLDLTAQAGTTYWYRVQSVDFIAGCGFGNLSAADSGFRGTPPPGPTGVAASDGTDCAGVLVSWSAASGTPAVSGYNVYRGPGSSTIPPTNAHASNISGLSYLDTSAVAGTTYKYWVKGVNSCGPGAYSAPDTGVRAATPSAPGGVNASDGTSCAGVVVTWNGVSGATQYRVKRNTTNSATGAAVVATGVASGWLDGTALPGQTLYYFVEAGAGVCWGNTSAGNSGFRAVPVSITTHPSSQALYPGQSAQFSVGAAGTAPLAYQWLKNGTTVANGGGVSGATSTTLSISSVTPAHAGTYSASVTNVCGAVQSNGGALTVLCYADCNADLVLTAADFGCFQTKFVAGNPYADCDGSGTLTVADFGCYQTKFVAGCP